MALPFPINANQTDAKSPIDQDLMDSFRLNQEYLDSQVGAGSAGGIVTFRVNGFLTRIKALLDIGGGKKVDGGIVMNAVTFSNAKLYLEKGGLDGALEVDVLRHINLQHPISEIVAQYSGATQAVGRLGSALNTQAVSLATSTLNTQLINKPKPSQNIETITNIGGDSWLITFSGTTVLDDDYSIGDSITIAGATAGGNNGTFIINQINYDGLPSVVVTNASGVEQSLASGTGELELFEYEFNFLADDDFVVGEEVIMSGHTDGSNNGTFEIYKTNQGGNNIWVKNVGATQGSAVGTVQCTRFVYVFSVTPDDTQYIVGEKAEFSGHTSGNNNGKFIIRRVNEGGNNVYVSNSSGVTQGGSGGTAETLRWLYSTPVDFSSDATVGDTVKFSGHSSSNNDGTFTVLFVNRFTVDNLEVYNENGVVQAGVAGQITSGLKIVSFKEDFSANYLVDSSLVQLEGIASQSDDLDEEFLVKEINRGGFSNYNVVIDAPDLSEQSTSAGRVSNEARSIFLVRPRLEVAQVNQVRNFQTDTGATFVAGGVPSDSVLTMDIVEVPEGLPSTCVLALS